MTRDEKDIKVVLAYGTLRQDMGYTISGISDYLEKAVSLGLGTTFGKMYDAGHFPACVHDLDGRRIIGEVLSFNTVSARVWKKTLAAFDEYEGHPDLFKRELVTVVLANGTAIDAWMYYFGTAPKLELEPVVPSGDWKEHLDRRYADRLKRATT